MANMLFGKEFEGLQDDGLEGSLDEHQIFKEVFSEIDNGRSNNRCLVAGVINFESADTKQVNGICSNSVNSALIRQEDPHTVREVLKRNPGQGCDSEDLTLLARSNPDMNFKKMKLSIDDSGNEPCLERVLTSAGTLEGVDSIVSQPDSQSASHTVLCHLVESSSQGIAASCYLLKKRQFGPNIGHEIGNKVSLSCLDRNDPKETTVSKAIASPVSQESSATKFLIVSPPATAANMLGPVRPAKPRWKDYCFLELDEAELSLPKVIKNDPRPLLRYHINRLLRRAGWVIGRRKRNNKYNLVGEYVYKSPEGRPIREFHRAWSMCRQSLFDGNNLMRGIDAKQWTDRTHFMSDLSNTASQIEKLGDLETTASLAHLWCLLDPFASVVFIKKTIRLLKEGKAVKAKRNVIIHPYGKCDVGFCSDALQGLLSYHSDKGYMGPLKTVNGTATKSRSVSGNERISLHQNSLQTCGSDSTCEQTGISLFEVPVSSRNGHTSLGGSQTVFQAEDSNRSSVTCEKERVGNNGELLVGTDRDLSMICVKQEDETYDIKPNAIDWESVGVDSIGETDALKSRNDDSSFAGVALRRKAHKKSKRISEIKLTSLYQHDNPGPSSFYEAELQVMDGNVFNLGSRGQECFDWENHEQSGSRKSKKCRLKDDDLLISAIIKNKSCKSNNKRSISKSEPPRKRKSRKGSCKLLPRSLKRGGKHCMELKWSIIGQRTVLSWLIHSGVLSLNEVIQYRDLKDDLVVIDGFVTRDGILCKCCEKVLSVSEFKCHAGFRSNRPCLNLFMESGKPFTLCQLEAWSAEYKAKKGAPRTILIEEIDENDDSCGRCGDGGELICCDNCPSTFHQACLYAQEVPEGNWYCPQCTCQICGDVVNEKEASRLSGTLKCSQCEYKYHKACVEEKGMKNESASDTWFCGESCQEIYSGLQSRVGTMNLLSDGFCWSLLKCIHGDQKVHSAQRFVALKAECNSKLAVALTIMEECFLPMLDPRTGIDMIPHVVYNWGSQFARLNYCGFYTVVLEKDDVLISVASIRIHGATVAEMPLIATCSKYRRQGMCRRLLNSIELMLKSLKVEKLVISAIPGLVETWTEGFGFTPLEDHEKQSLSHINLMVFPGTVWLKKSLNESHKADEKAEVDDPATIGVASQGGPSTELGRSADLSLTVQDAQTEILRLADSEKAQSHEDHEGSGLQNQEPHSAVCSNGIEFEQHFDQNLSVEESGPGKEKGPDGSENSCLNEDQQDISSTKICHDEPASLSEKCQLDIANCLESLEIDEKTILLQSQQINVLQENEK